MTRSLAPETQSSFDQDQKLLEEAFVLQKSGKLEQAKEKYHALTSSVDVAFDAHHMLGVIYAAKKNYGRAFHHCEQALERGTTPDLHYNVALIAWRAEKMETMLKHTEKLAEMLPDDERVHSFYARYYLHNRENDQALLHAQLAWNKDVSRHKSLYCRALVANDRYTEALDILRQEKEPSLLYAHYLLDGDLYEQEENWQEAEQILLKLVVTETDKKRAANAQATLGKLAERQQKDDSTIEKRLRHAQRLDPNNPMHKIGLGFSLLKQKKWLEGFTLLQERRKLPAMQVMLSRYREVPELVEKKDVKRIEGNHIVVLSEQGIGDNLQFMRFIPMLRQFKPSCISLHVPPSLKNFAMSLDGVQHIVTDGDSLSDVNFVIPMMSLPSLFDDAEIEKAVATKCYLHSTGEGRILLPEPVYPTKIGIAWQGNIHFAEDNRRSIKLATLRSLLIHTPVTFYALQKPTSKEFRALAKEQPHLIDLSQQLHDFNDTAHIIRKLDLVISVDTSLLHLAGTMGIKAIGLIPPVGDWRWHHDEISSWYPSVKLIRARKTWNDVIEHLQTELQAYCKTTPSLDNLSKDHQNIMNLMECGEWQNAFQEARKITSIRLEPKILHLQGIAALQMGDKEQALLALQQALRTKDSRVTSLDVLHDLMAFYIVENEPHHALSVFMNALEQDLFDKKTFRLLLRHVKQDNQLMLRIRKKRRKFRHHILLEQAQTYLYLYAKKFTEAEAILKQMEDDKEGIWTRDRLWSLLARQALQAGDRTIAKRAMEQAVQIKGDDPQHQINYNLILAAQGEINRSILNLRKATNENPHPDVILELCKLLDASGEREQARSILENALRYHAHHSALLEMKKSIDNS